MSITTPPHARLVIEGLTSAPSTSDAVDSAILESTLRCIALYGTARLTMADVARSAGVGRATVFRRFESKDELIRRAFSFELARIVEGFAETVAAVSHPGEHLVEIIVAAVRTARTHPIGTRLVEDGTAVAIHRDPDLAQLQLLMLTDRISDCAEQLAVDVDTTGTAEVLLRFIGSVWLTPDIGLPTTDDDAIRRMVRVILHPLIP
ncbi:MULTISPECIES: TetR/AcrR family transcriptional regulator [Gordonia]|uniref:TetR/AcrR family transcriptional regulator n=1 Tax=Gordonia TaxID=2053 RepID=UPI00054E5223|nr:MULTISPECIES: TetR/AcrR family transcriptional regulator [Gordonia]MDH3007204.1 helix-turn-helix domain containing protein [Gordonia alkanivorans]MDH3016993.1 helix-turn-helix domain containing protein [Gordonia alkanivorans]MDH3022228.1 helix-turn-helix domain containing protein [Gordonia alkanivorans]MDH3026107.1 helix-turn-helix domain containing protein [Gordonia alkanivorans]MDH3042260.1 helix-turn-helix domain containing protein [Gordonia alkanivorans]